jgi:hypothetical protein
MTARITGYAAIDYAARTGATLRKHADPEDGAREVTAEEARAIVREDAGLVYVEAPTAWAQTMMEDRLRELERYFADLAAGEDPGWTPEELFS